MCHSNRGEAPHGTNTNGETCHKNKKQCVCLGHTCTPCVFLCSAHRVPDDVAQHAMVTLHNVGARPCAPPRAQSVGVSVPKSSQTPRVPSRTSRGVKRPPPVGLRTSQSTRRRGVARTFPAGVPQPPARCRGVAVLRGRFQLECHSRLRGVTVLRGRFQLECHSRLRGTVAAELRSPVPNYISALSALSSAMHPRLTLNTADGILRSGLIVPDAII